jgi:hypothetical protein
LGHHDATGGVKFICSDGSSSEPYTFAASIGLAVTRALS